MIIGSVMEFILGNTFPFVVFGSFGAFWLAYAATLQPLYYAYGLYAAAGDDPATGIATTGFTASFAFFLVFMGLLCFIFLVCSIRTNVVFVIIFLNLILAFLCLAGAFFHNANSYAASNASDVAHYAALASRMQIAGGACLFVATMAGWWILAAIMLASLDFPFQIPVGDLSTLIKGASEKQKMKTRRVRDEEQDMGV
jgi:succinate-acetate transporter protein